MTDTHQHIDRGLYTYITSYLAQAYRLSIIIDKPTVSILSHLMTPTGVPRDRSGWRTIRKVPSRLPRGTRVRLHRIWEKWSVKCGTGRAMGR